MPTIPCPICKQPVDAGAEDFPFCSERCRTIDLGNWASGEYKISSPIFDPELLDDPDLVAELERAEEQADPPKEWKN
jgi:endogenous inhibitor of DNA gyrase (YacG/DUF329 family)